MLRLRNLFIFEEEKLLVDKESDTVNIDLSPQQAETLSRELEMLGINTGEIIVKDNNIVEAKKQSLPRYSLKISKDTLEQARKYYEIGKKDSGWYYEIGDLLKDVFKGNERDRVLFVTLLAATSVRAGIDINFIHTALLFNSIKEDWEKQPLLLHAWANSALSKFSFWKQNKFKGLVTVQMIEKGKLGTVQAKLPNILRIIKELTSGNLTAEKVKARLVNSIDFGTGMEISSKNPILQRYKIANYALTILDPNFAHSPNNPLNVVIDTWMLRIFYPQLVGNIEMAKTLENAFLSSLSKSNKVYKTIADKIAALAAEVGVAPHVFQAGAWSGIKQTYVSRRAIQGSTTYARAAERIIAEVEGFIKEYESDVEKIKAALTLITPQTATSARSFARSTPKNEEDIID